MVVYLMNPTHKLSDIDKVAICDAYIAGARISVLAKQHDVTYCNIYKLLQRRGIPIRGDSTGRYTFNRAFFRLIDTEEKAYWLGFLYADGWLTPQRNTVSLGLKADDSYILSEFVRHLDGDRPVTPITRKGTNPQARVEFTDADMIADLIRQGCTAQKTFSILFPSEGQVPPQLLHHFIRGYFDGDGSVWFRRKAGRIVEYQCSVVSTEHFCRRLREVCQRLLGVNLYVRQANRKTAKQKVYSAELCGRDCVRTFLAWLYKDATVYLKRKHDRYLVVCSGDRFATPL